MSKKKIEGSVELGDKVKDVVSGFEGIVTGYTVWLTGCDSVHITGKSKEGSGESPTASVDVTRIEIQEKEVIKLQVQNTRTAPKEKRAAAPGGPHPKFDQPKG